MANLILVVMILITSSEIGITASVGQVGQALYIDVSSFTKARMPYRRQTDDRPTSGYILAAGVDVPSRGRYTRLWHLLFYAGCSRKHACFSTDPGLQRLHRCGLLTEVKLHKKQKQTCLVTTTYLYM